MSFIRSTKLHRFRIVAVIGAVLLAAAPVWCGQDQGLPGPGCEPRLPLEVKLRAVETGRSGTTVLLSLELAAKADLAAVRLELLLPESARLLDEFENQGAGLARGERRSRSFRVAFVGPSTVQVKVVAVTAAGLVFRRGASLELDGDGRPVRRAPGGTVRRSPEGGRTVREFPARAVEEAGR